MLPRFQPGHRGGLGRKTGVPNKMTSEVREAIALAFQGIGGVPKLIEWAEANQSLFYTAIWLKLLPLSLKLDQHIIKTYNQRQIFFER
jgi:hypothetical protein